MRLIQAQLRTWWNDWLKPDGSRPDGSRPEMDCGRRWIAAGYGSRPDIDGRPEVDDRRWITGDG